MSDDEQDVVRDWEGKGTAWNSYDFAYVDWAELARTQNAFDSAWHAWTYIDPVDGYRYTIPKPWQESPDVINYFVLYGGLSETDLIALIEPAMTSSYTSPDPHFSHWDGFRIAAQALIQDRRNVTA